MNRNTTIRWNGRVYPILEKRVIGRRTYFFLERLSGPEREKYFAFCPHAGLGGDVCMVHALRRKPDTFQLLKVLVRIRNRNLATILDFHDAGESIYLIAKWVRGESLARRLERAKTSPKLWPSPWMAFRLYRGLAHGLHQLNTENIIHGDIKPANMVLDRASLVLIDFGSSWTVENSVSRLAGDGRSDGYASPEQHLKSSVINFRSDMFSATSVFFEMLTGELPYARMGGKAALPQFRPTFESTLYAPSMQNRDRLKMPAEFWPALDEVVVKCLALDQEKRLGDTHSWIRILNDIDARLTIAASENPAPLGFWANSMARLFQWIGRKLVVRVRG